MIATGHGWGLAVFPLLAFGVSSAFAVHLAARFVRKHRPHEGVWALALALYAAASVAMALGVANGWTPGEFRAYWLFGAVLNVPYLFGGEMYLLIRRRAWGHAALVALLLLSAFAADEVVRAAVRARALSNVLPLGKDAFGDGSTPYRLAQYYALPAYFLLLFGLVWSSVQMRGNAALRPRAFGVFVIAVGATVVAIGSGIGAAFHVVALFSVTLAIGVAVMYWGFLRTSAPARRPAV